MVYICMLSCSVVSYSLRHHSLQPVRLLGPWEFSRQEYWSGLPYPPPGDLPNPGIKPRFPLLQADSLSSEPPGKPWDDISSVQFSCLVMSSSLQPHELQHARPSCPSPTPQTHVHCVSDTIQPSHSLSSPSPPALNLSQNQGLFK